MKVPRDTQRLIRCDLLERGHLARFKRQRRQSLSREALAAFRFVWLRAACLPISPSRSARSQAFEGRGLFYSLEIEVSLYFVL